LLDIELIRDKVLNKTFITDIYYFKELDSTNEFAKKLDDKDNVLILTDNQTAGKGRLGKEWVSEKEKNLTFTIKKKFKIDPEESNYINFFFSYFLLESIKEFLNKNLPNLNSDNLQIKWPNDILMNSKKLCGLLIESVVNKDEYIIGIGLNVNQEKFNSAFDACSLIEYTKSEINLSELLIHIIFCFSRNLSLLEQQNFGLVFNSWKESTKMIGKSVEFIDPKNVKKTAKIKDFLENGGIKLLISDEEKVYFSGEVKITGFGR